MSLAPDQYYTVAALAEGIYKEKGSKFIGYVVPCYSEEEAKTWLEQWRKAHHQARHVCYAYRFGLDKTIYRANDDGEPSNSAGTPILGQIQSFDLTNVLIGVVRYFGGTKLGVGGLIHAYKTAAREAIEAGTIVQQQVFQQYQLDFTYDEMPAVMSYCKQQNAQIQEQLFDLSCRLILAVPLSKSSPFENEIPEKVTIIPLNEIPYL